MQDGAISAEVALASAVIGRAVVDLKKGSGEHRERARADIEEGCLDYWIEVVDAGCEIGPEIRRQLGNLVG